MGRCQIQLENEISIFKKLVSRRKHEVLQNILVNGCSDIGFQKTQWTNTSRWHCTPNHHRLWKLNTGLKATGLWASPPFLQTLGLFTSGSQRRRSLSLPVLTLIFPALLPCLVRDSLCTALQTKILWINWSLNAIDTMETWVSGNLTAPTERSQPAIRWRVGEMANRVSGGSFRGGHWYLPIRNHDNRYFADWIRLFPGLSKNSENGNSCPKPHKAARMIEAVGRAVSETEL